MSAILSPKFRSYNAKNFFNRIADATDKLYVAIGKADPWDSDIAGLTDVLVNPTNDTQNITNAWAGLTGMTKVSPTEVSFVVPKYFWSSGLSTWVAWDSTDQDIYDKRFYCLTDENNVYKLLKKGLGTSTDKPTHLSVAPVAGADGYVWKYMYTIEEEETRFITNDFIPVQTATAGTRLTYQNQSAGTEGSGDYSNPKGIENIRIANGGTGYPADPTLIITGDGTGATATATTVGGVITTITITNKGTGYSTAHIEIDEVTGSGADLRIAIAPGAGHGTDPVEEFGGKYIEVAAILQANQNTDLVVDNDFRQLCLILNPLLPDGVTPATDETYNPVKALVASVAADAANITTSDYVVGSVSGAKAYVVAYDASVDVGYIYIVQNEKTGYGTFQAGETITGAGVGSPTIVLDGVDAYAANKPEVKFNSGEILMLENIDAITRGNNQTEDVKIVIEF